MIQHCGFHAVASWDLVEVPELKTLVLENLGAWEFRCLEILALGNFGAWKAFGGRKKVRKRGAPKGSQHGLLFRKGKSLPAQWASQGSPGEALGAPRASKMEPRAFKMEPQASKNDPWGLKNTTPRSNKCVSFPPHGDMLSCLF